jgi:hypothetical protein
MASQNHNSLIAGLSAHRLTHPTYSFVGVSYFKCELVSGQKTNLKMIDDINFIVANFCNFRKHGR